MGTCHPFYHCLIECSHSGNIVVSGLASEVENYISLVQDQELPTKFLKNKRDRDSGKNPSFNNKWSLCINNVEDISHIVGGCS